MICSGTPFEMGVAQGAAVGADIRSAYGTLRHIEAFRLRQPRWIPFAGYRRMTGLWARYATSRPVLANCREQYERTRGIAAGSGIRPDDLWLLQAVEALLGSVDGMTVTPPAGCSAVAVRGSRSAEGVPLIAHNFDYLPAIQPFYIVRESRPQGRFRSIEFSAAPLSGAVDGVNEAGLAITYNYAHTLAGLDPWTPGPTISMRISETLAESATVADALARLQARSRWGSGLLMLADAAGDMASLELSNTRAAVRRPDMHTDVLYHTNKFVCPSTASLEPSSCATFDNRAPHALRGHRVLRSALSRMKRLDDVFAGAACFSPDTLAGLMADHGGGEPSDETICMHGDYWTTSACVQCLPAARTIRVSFGTACNAAFVDYAL